MSLIDELFYGWGWNIDVCFWLLDIFFFNMQKNKTKTNRIIVHVIKTFIGSIPYLLFI